SQKLQMLCRWFDLRDPATSRAGIGRRPEHRMHLRLPCAPSLRCALRSAAMAEESKPKWITIEDLERWYCRALRIEIDPYSISGHEHWSEAHNAAHHRFCRDASQAGLSEILQFQGRAGDANKAEQPMAPIPKNHFGITRGFEGNVIKPFSYGAPMDEY